MSVMFHDNVYTYDNLQAHHIIPIAKDYNKKLDSDNLITLCIIHYEQAEKGIISKEELYELLEVPRREGIPKYNFFHTHSTYIYTNLNFP